MSDMRILLAGAAFARFDGGGRWRVYTARVVSADRTTRAVRDRMVAEDLEAGSRCRRVLTRHPPLSTSSSRRASSSVMSGLFAGGGEILRVPPAQRGHRRVAVGHRGLGQPQSWYRSAPLDREHPQAHPAGRQVLHRVDQVGEVAAEAVELPDDEHVVVPECPQAAVEPRPVVAYAGGEVVIEVDLVDAGRVRSLEHGLEFRDMLIPDAERVVLVIGAGLIAVGLLMRQERAYGGNGD